MKYIITLVTTLLISSASYSQLSSNNWSDGGNFIYPTSNENIQLKNNKYIGWKDAPSSASGAFTSFITDIGNGVLGMQGASGVSIGLSIFTPKFEIDEMGRIGIGRPATTDDITVAGDIIKFMNENGNVEMTMNMGIQTDANVGLFTDENLIFISANNGEGTIAMDGVLEVTTAVGPSDIRLKKNIKHLGNGISTITKLRPVQYNMIKDDKTTHIGLIAQEVEAVIPSITSNLSQLAEDGTPLKGIKYQELIPVLIKAIQEQQDLIEQQAADIKDLQKNVSE